MAAITASVMCGTVACSASTTDIGQVEVQGTPTQGSTGHPHEPPGMTLIGDNPFDVAAPSGWTCYACAQLSIEDAPNLGIQSPGRVAAAQFPTGFVGGSAPINLARSGFSVDSLYIHFTFAVSANWNGHSSNINKIFFITNSSHDDLGFTAYGSGSNPLSFQIFTQNVVGSGQYYRANITGGEIRRGVPVEIEVLIVMDSGAGNADGQLHVWMDGRKTHQHTGVNTRRSGDDDTINELFWNPTYGGGNVDSVPSVQYQYIDHLYLSGN
jgi:hypothetical protein